MEYKYCIPNQSLELIEKPETAFEDLTLSDEAVKEVAQVLKVKDIYFRLPENVNTRMNLMHLDFKIAVAGQKKRLELRDVCDKVD